MLCTVLAVLGGRAWLKAHAPGDGAAGTGYGVGLARQAITLGRRP